MNNKSNTGKSIEKFGIPAAVILSYLSAICALPSSGIFTSLPVAAVFAFAISFFCKNRRFIYLAMAAMHFLAPLLFGFGMKSAVVSAVIATVSAFFAVLAKRAIFTIKHTDDGDVKKKSKTVLVFSAVICFAVWLSCCGNPISLLMADAANKDTAEEKYPQKLETGATFFDVTRFEYVTEIFFKNGSGAKHYYISSGKTDDYMNFHLEETLLDAMDSFAGKSALPANGLKCYIDKDEFIFGDSSANYAIAEYLIPRQEPVTGMDGFVDLYNNLTKYAEASDALVYKRFIMTAKGLDGKSYYALKEFGSEPVFSVDNEALEKEINEKYK